jgi:hypothetical protein
MGGFEVIHVEGVIDNVFMVDWKLGIRRKYFKQKFVERKKKVFFCGAVHKSWGYVESLDNSLKRNMLSCDIDVEKADSGGLLFFVDNYDKSKLTALGILSCQKNGRGIFFSTFAECFDDKIFELP